ncbi:MAG: ThuA domain-containing protein [Verrucomicrobiales bacterium]
MDPCAKARGKIKVLVWDERQPIGKKVYPNFPGNRIADYLHKNPALDVKSANINEPDQGLSSKSLANTDVLLFWSHVRHRDISEMKGQEIFRLVKPGNLNFVPLHSSHWSVPFMVCMQDKAAEDALASLPVESRARGQVTFAGKIQWKKASEFDRNSASPDYQFNSDGKITVTDRRPNCVFPRCCGPGQPSLLRIIHKTHPICRGLPANFTLPLTEMYDEPFGIPEPDTLLFTEQWAAGEFFRSGCLWKFGRGRIFYFRPGDQAYPIYDNTHLLKILENACLWLGAKG